MNNFHTWSIFPGLQVLSGGFTSLIEAETQYIKIQGYGMALLANLNLYAGRSWCFWTEVLEMPSLQFL